MSGEKKILIIAGPNGAGKTTFARRFLPAYAECPIFINADLIAAGLSPFAPEIEAIRAGRLMLDRIDDYVRQGASLAFETTLSARTYASKIQQWQRLGYRVKLIYLSLTGPEMALARVAARVAEGGHSIPEDVIRRRFESGWRNFQEIYKPIVDAWMLFDNSGEKPRLIETGTRA